MVATNEFRRGLARRRHQLLHRGQSPRRHPRPQHLHSSTVPAPTPATTTEQRLDYLGMPDFDPVTRWACHVPRRAPPTAASPTANPPPPSQTLEGFVGRDTMDEAMRTWFIRFRFTHPTTEDFLRTIEEVAIKNGKAISLSPRNTPAIESHNELSGATEITARPCTPLNLFDQTAVASARAQLAKTATLDQYHVVVELPPDAPPPCPRRRQIGMTGPIPFSGDFATALATNSTLRPFFNQAVYGTQTPRLRHRQMSAPIPVQWWLPEPKDRQRQILWRNRRPSSTAKATSSSPSPLRSSSNDGTRLARTLGRRRPLDQPSSTTGNAKIRLRRDRPRPHRPARHQLLQ